MKDPRRFCDGPPSDPNTALLRSWQPGDPSVEGMLRTRARLGLAALGTGLTLSAAAEAATSAAHATHHGLGAAAAIGKLAILKWLGVGMVAGLSVGLGVVEIGKSKPAASGPPQGASLMAVPGSALPGGHRVSDPVAAPSVPSPSATSAPWPQAPAGQAASSHHPSPAGAESAPASTLTDEVNAIDRIRLALAQGRCVDALRGLEDYQRLGTIRALRPEATLLYIDALEHCGRPGQAAALADRYLLDYPLSPQADRLRALIARARSTKR
jgi:hypothetical protein